MTSREKRELMELLNVTCNKIEKSGLCDGLCHNCTIFKGVSSITELNNEHLYINKEIKKNK